MDCGATFFYQYYLNTLRFIKGAFDIAKSTNRALSFIASLITSFNGSSTIPQRLCLLLSKRNRQFYENPDTQSN